MDYLDAYLMARVMLLIPLILSLSVHEWAHAWVARKLGDDTAARLGRLTLNPVAHVDPVGTLLLPLAGVPFGWARPVPVNPVRFHRTIQMRTGMMLVAVAGPLSNACIALGCAAVAGLAGRIQPGLVEGGSALRRMLEIFMILNALLAVFNALPIPPLDGSRVVDGLISGRLRPAWDSLKPYGFIILLCLILGPALAGTSLIGPLLEWVRSLLDGVVRVFGG